MEQDRLRHAALLLQHHRPAEAERELRTHLAATPEDVRALLMLSSALGLQDKDKESVATARQAVGLAPDLDATHFHLGRALLAVHDLKAARQAAEEAVRLDPEDADNHGLLALVLHHANEHTEALAAAERGLAVDPEHLGCLNVRSAELAHLKRYTEADNTIDKALGLDPENPYTHSNTGWAALRRGDQARALEHFREALRREPGLESARRGMIEALKARYWPYRIWLRYVFWVSNLKSGTRTFFIIGIWLGMRLLSKVGGSLPLLSAIIWPLMIAYILFAFSTWVITPLTNLLLRLNRYGRYALNAEEKRTSTFTGLALLVALCGLLGLLFAQRAAFLAVIGYGLLLMIPLASMSDGDRPRDQWVRQGLTVLLAVIGAGGIAVAFSSGDPFNPWMQAFAIGAIAYQWLVVLVLR